MKTNYTNNQTFIAVTPSIFRIITGILITEKMSGKMEGMQSLSTSCLVNPYCQARRKIKDSICSKCYAASTLEYRKNQDKAYIVNFEILTSRMLEKHEIPVINAKVFRFEAFGDIYNLTQMYNYIQIAKGNPDVNFALWSKNIAIVEKAFVAFGKPENFIYVYSALDINEEIDVDMFRKNHPFVNHVFIVVNAEYALANNITINCARKCISCLKCYYKNTDFVIYEILKQEEKKYFNAIEN